MPDMMLSQALRLIEQEKSELIARRASIEREIAELESDLSLKTEMLVAMERYIKVEQALRDLCQRVKEFPDAMDSEAYLRACSLVDVDPEPHAR